MSLNVFKIKLMYISSRLKQQILSNWNHNISICDSKYMLDLLENVLGSQLVILSAGMLIFISLLKSVILIYSYCRE